MENKENLYPVKNCMYEESEEGIVTLLLKRNKKGFLDRTLFKKWADKKMKVDLDEIGTFIWYLCNGKNTVADITAKAEEKFGERVEPVDKRIELFLKKMAQSKFIVLYEKR